MPDLLKTLDGLPKEVHGLYEESDDGFRFTGIPDVDGLKNKNRELLSEKKKVSEKLKMFDGIDPEEFAKLKDAAAKAVEDAAIKSGDIDALKMDYEKRNQTVIDQMKAEHQVTLVEAEDKVSRMRARLNARLIDAEAVSAIAEAGGEPKLLLPIVKAQVKMFEEDGDFVARVVNPDGSIKTDGSGKNEPMTIPQLIELLKGDNSYGRAFSSSGMSGSDSRPGGFKRSSGGGNLSSEQAGNLSMAEYKKARAEGRI